MEDKEAIEILTKMLQKYQLDEREAEAVRAAIGVMGWTKLAEGWKNNVKAARDRRNNDES